MKQDSKGVILKSLFEGHINEAKQAIHVVKYTWDGVKVAELVCYTNTYNKLKKLKGYKELDHTQLEDEDIIMIANRGNPLLLKSLQASAKQVSKQNGISNLNVIGESKIQVKPINNAQLDYNSTGAYASMMKKSNTVSSESIIKETSSYNFEHMLYDRLTESIESVGETKEYFNATSSLFTLYALGKLNENVMDSISREDIREIKGIIREFKSIIDSY